VVVLDDLHWADRPSLLLLQFLARELEGSRLVVLGTYRDVELGRQHPLEETLAALARERRSERILLRGLAEPDVARFIELTASRTPPRALVEAVFRETEGNPFFVHEVVRLLQRDGRLDQLDSVGSWSIEIPQGVRQVVGRRLDALSEGCNELLRTASVIGRDFDLGLLADVSGQPEASVLERLEEAEEARVVTAAERGGAVYRFAHALVRETLYSELRTIRRVRLHRAIAQALERRHADRVEPQLASLSYHFCEAAPGGDVEKAVDYAMRAAERATELLAYEEAAGHLERALSVLEGAGPAHDRRRCELRVRLGGARASAGQPVEAHEAYVTALELARRIASADLFAVAAIADTDAAYIPASAEMANPAPLEEALRLIGDDNPGLRIRVTARLALQLIYIDMARSRELLDAGLALARRTREDRGLFEVLRARRAVIQVGGEEEMNEQLALAVRMGDPRLELSARANRIGWLMRTGDADRLDEEVERYAALAARLRQPTYRQWAALQRACRALIEGRLREAAEAAREAWQEGARVHPEQSLQFYGLHAFALNRLRGQLARTEEPLAVGAKRYPGNPLWLHLQALMLAETGRTERARALFEQASVDDFAVIRALQLQQQASLTLLADVVAADRRPEGAEALYRHIVPFAGTLVVQGTLLPLGSSDRCLGNLAAVRGCFDEAFAHFDAAIALETRARARGWLPRTQLDYARALAERGKSGDAERARQLLDASLATSRELGLRAWLDLALALKLELQGIASGTLSAGRSIDVVAATIGERRPDLSSQTAPDGTVTLMFSDVAGFTEMTERLGDVAAREVIREHNRIVREQLAEHDGHEVELQGDGFLLAFASARRALECAIALQRAFAERNRSAAEPIHLRIGLHTGQALRDADRFFGRTVILAARIADQAVGDEILISAALKPVAESAPRLRLGSERDAALKGISEPQHLARVEWH
jgi:class 3 adenylate cyclase